MKKAFATIGLLLPFTAVAAGLTVFVEGQFVTFADVPQDAWFATHVRGAAEGGIVSGYKDASGKLSGKFGPADPVTIEQALKIAVEGSGFDETKYPLPAGFDGSRWSDAYLAVGVGEHFSFFDNPDVAFTANATRGQVSQLIVDAFQVDVETTLRNQFTDVHRATQYSLAIEALARDGVVAGDTNASGQLTGKFRPEDRINRAETVKIVMNARARYGQPGRTAVPPKEAAGEVRTVIVTYEDDVFTPASVEVTKGTTVIFVNENGGDMLVASDPHPTHVNYPEFDSKSAKYEFSFTFTKTGTWGYHNHFKPGDKGTIIVK